MKQILLILALLLPVCAFSQFVETFDGSQLNAAWKGDRGLFTINNNRQLQFDASGRTDTLSIQTPIDYSETMEWTFDVALSFKPTTKNYLKICVYGTGGPSDDIYFIRLGYSKCNVSFCEWDIDKPLIDGRNSLGNYPSSISIKLTLEDSRYWTLYTRIADESCFTKEGTYENGTLSDTRPGGNLLFRYYCQAKTLPNIVYCLDNIRVSPEITPTNTTPEEPEPEPGEPEEPSAPSDPILPQLLDIVPQSTSELQFLFDNEVNIDKASFSISGIGKAIRKNYGETKAIVNTSFPSPMQVDTEYTISYAGLTSTSGKQLPEDSWTAVFESDGEPDIPSLAGAVLINEVMADPKGLKKLAETEYVELYNSSDKAVQLKGWTFLYGDKTSVVLPGCLLPADGYVVLYREGRTIVVDKPGLSMPLAKFPSALANAGKDLAIEDAAGIRIDEIAYDKAKPGISWERSAKGWCLSTDPRGGTPGTVNSSSETEPEEPEEPETPNEPETPENPEEPETPDEPSEPETPEESDVAPLDIVLNELLPEPFTGGSEYIELYNRSGKPVSLKGLSVATRKTDGSLSTHYPLSSIPSALAVDGFALLTKDKEAVSSFYLASVPGVIHELKLPILANTSSTLVLFRSKDEVVIDEVSYSSRWHAASVKNKKGVALERIDPDARTQDSGNWASASGTAGYGTPGYRNSQMKKPEDGGTTGIEPPLFIDATGFYSIAYHLDKPGYSCRAYIFDLSGRRVAEIANHELLGIEGELTWDGIATDGRRLGTGIYILYIEFYHTGGHTRTYKKAFPVR